MPSVYLRRLAVAAAVIGAVVASAIAVFAPTSAFDAVLAGFIGHPGHAATTVSQRLIAVVGAVLGAIAIASVALRIRPRTLPAKPRRGVLLVAFGGLLAMNALALAHRSGVLRGVYPPRWSYTLLALVVSVGCAWFLAGPEPRRVPTPRRDVPLWVAAAAGAGYGCFSGLWHCCRPWWASTDWAVSSIDIVWFSALALALGAVGRVAASARTGLGEALGAVVFGVTYPWHTALFFAQNLVGGAFATALVRVTGSGWSPALFLGTAYLTHTTLPFVGPFGAVLASGLLLASIVLTVRQRRFELAPNG